MIKILSLILYLSKLKSTSIEVIKEQRATFESLYCVFVSFLTKKTLSVNKFYTRTTYLAISMLVMGVGDPM